MANISKYFEPIVLTLFILIFLWVGLANPYLNEIKHTRPHAHLASDAFFHQSVADYMESIGKIKFTPSYEVGGHPLVYDQHPPALFELSALFSKVSGLEVYDSIYLLVVLMALLTTLVFYILARKVKKEIAYLSLPVCILIFSKSFNVNFFWGFWLFITGAFFMVASLWIITRLELKKSYLLMGIFLAATAISHIPEAVYVGIFIIIFLAIDIFRNRKINLELIKKIGISAAIGIILAIFHINIFARTMLISEGYRNVWDLKNVARLSGLPAMPLSSLGITGIIALVGYILFLLTKKRKTFDAASVSLFCFGINYLILLGVGKRAYIHRFFWFLYISFLFGFAIYQLLRILNKKWAQLAAFCISIILIIPIGMAIAKNTKVGSGILDQDSWNSLMWIRKNIPDDARVYYFYSDVYRNKAVMYNSHHVSFILDAEEVIENIQKGQISRIYHFGLADSYHDYICPLGKFTFGYYRNRLWQDNPEYKCEKGYKALENVPNEEKNKDICTAEYIVFTKGTIQPVLAQYNIAVRNILLQTDWIDEIYSNNMVSILKNNKPGVDCIGTNSTQ